MRFSHVIFATLAIASCVLLGGATPAKPVKSALSLPPSDSLAQQRLNSSPRHGEFVDIAYSDGIKLRTWVVYPERKDKAGVVIVIQEVFGLTDWLRSVADQLAREGFIAVAPDMISGLGPNGGGTESVASRDDAVAITHGVTPEEANRRLNSVRLWALGLAAGNGKVATVGFCWGGARSFAFAAAQPALDAAVVYYGASPETGDLARIKAPVEGHYGGDDARVDATIPPAETEMKRLGKTYHPHIYEGAGHGFLRDQAGRDGANLRAARQAWPATVAFLKERLK